MNPFQIIGLIIPLIEKLPSIEAGIMALIQAIKGMIDGGINVTAVGDAVGQALPQVTAAIVANTPQASPVLIVAGTANATADELNAAAARQNL